MDDRSALVWTTIFKARWQAGFRRLWHLFYQTGHTKKASAIVLGLCYIFPVVEYDKAPTGSGGGFMILGYAAGLVVVGVRGP